MRPVSQAIAEAYQKCKNYGIKPLTVHMHPQTHRDLIAEMGEPAGSRLWIVGGMDVLLDNTMDDVVRVNGVMEEPAEAPPHANGG